MALNRFEITDNLLKRFKIFSKNLVCWVCIDQYGSRSRGPVRMAQINIDQGTRGSVKIAQINMDQGSVRVAQINMDQGTKGSVGIIIDFIEFSKPGLT